MSTKFYKLFVPSQSTASADTIHFDLFNVSGSGLDVYVHHIYPTVSGDVALTGTLGPDLHLMKTSAVGTGGTDATVEGTTITAMTISAYGHSDPIQLTKVSARLTPTGGATSAGLLAWTSVFTEETNAGSYDFSTDLVKRGNPTVPPMRVRGGTGVKVIQGSVGTSGTIGFDVLFHTQPG